MKKWLIASCLVMSACGASPMRLSNSANAAVKVEVLTEFDGIRLYRIQDGTEGRPVYVAISASEIRTTWDRQSGKTTVRNETITLRMPR